MPRGSGDDQFEVFDSNEQHYLVNATIVMCSQ